MFISRGQVCIWIRTENSLYSICSECTSVYYQQYKQHAIPCSAYGGYTLSRRYTKTSHIPKQGRGSVINRNSKLYSSEGGSKQDKKGIKAQLVEGKVTIASINNVDVLQPYTFVCTLDDTRSGNGTSVQCVQPFPKSGNLTESDLHPHELHASIAPPPAPPAHVCNSPIPILKKKHQKCTLTEHYPHTAMVAPQLHQVQPYLLLKLIHCSMPVTHGLSRL